MKFKSLAALTNQVIRCEKCPRLVSWRQEVAVNKRAAFRDQTYWGKPIPGFGDPNARVLVLGLAPAAHGGNRTGRVFTGDRSGDWLFTSLYRAGFSNQAESTDRGDGLELKDCYITACVRCAPPDNKPAIEERDNCQEFLIQEFQLLKAVKVIVCLGSFAWDGGIRLLRHLGFSARPKPKFGHAAEVEIGPYVLLGSYHPSQQNTFTGRLTEKMLDGVFHRAEKIIRSQDV